LQYAIQPTTGYSRSELAFDSVSNLIEYYEAATAPIAGAYYNGVYFDGAYINITNTGSSALDITHVALVARSTVADTISAAVEGKVFFVFPTNLDNDTGEENPLALAVNQTLWMPFSAVDGFGGAVVGSGTSFKDYVDGVVAQLSDPAYDSSPLLETAATEAYSLRTPGTSWLPTSMRLSILTPTITVLAVALNVTGSIPDFEELWDAWSTYSVKRYAVTQFNVNLESFTDTAEIEIGGTPVGLLGTAGWRTTPGIEALVLPPSSSSFTYTHVAIFINDITSAPLPGSNFTPQSPTNFLGVIDVGGSVTLSSTGTIRAYPFQFHVTLNSNLLEIY
jgi:hypothetical protein